MPKEYGWNEVDGVLVTKWFEGDCLPSDEEYDAHVNEVLRATIQEHYEEEYQCSNESDSDNDSEYAISETYSSSDDDDVEI